MKTITRFAFAIVFLIVVTACSESHSTLTLKKNGKAVFEYSFGLIEALTEAARQGGNEPFGKIKEALEKSGFQVSTYQENGYEGIKAQKEFHSIEALEKTLSENKEFIGTALRVEVKKGLVQTMRTLHITTDFSSLGEDMIQGEEEGGMIPPDFAKSRNYTYTVKVPFRVLDHNASEIDEKENLYRWKLDPASETEMTLTYRQPEGIVLILAAFAVLLALVFVFFLLWKKGIISFKKEPEFVKK